MQTGLSRVGENLWATKVNFNTSFFDLSTSRNDFSFKDIVGCNTVKFISPRLISASSNK